MNEPSVDLIKTLILSLGLLAGFMLLNLHLFTFYTLKIFCLHTEKVTKPSITCEEKHIIGSNVSAVLQCSAELNQTQSLAEFKWTLEENIHQGQKLTIYLGGELDEKQYTCQVSNPVGSETATFTARDCNTGRISFNLVGHHEFFFFSHFRV